MLTHNRRNYGSRPPPRFPAVPYQLLAIGVFPAHAGMTRAALTDAESVWCVPRPRGDDP